MAILSCAAKIRLHAISVIALGLVLIVVAKSRANDLAPKTDRTCIGQYNGKHLDAGALKTILAKHAQWLSAPKSEQHNGDNAALWANLCGAYFDGNSLQGADLRWSNLEGAHLEGVDLTKAQMTGADLDHAMLTGAILNYADLSNAFFDYADLQGASLWQTKLNGAYLYYAKVSSSWLDSDTNSLPDIVSTGFIDDLEQTKCIEPDTLSALREEFGKRGRTDRQAALTYAIGRSATFKSPFPLNWLRWITLDLTYGYGLKPGRALLWLLGLMLVFTPFYVAAQRRGGAKGGIWATWPSDRIVKEKNQDEPVLITNGFQSFAAPGHRGRARNSLSVWALAIYFSLLSAFRIGWHDLNFGTWFTRLQAREYLLKASGWVRVVSGVQSLLSVYLFGLWVIAMFGNGSG